MSVIFKIGEIILDTIKVGIMGGSFDPIHNGHLIISERARDQFKLDRVIFIPTGNPPHKNKGRMSSVEDRYRMTQLAIEGNRGYSISDIEASSQATTYTFDTLRTLSQENDKYELYFILGADSFINFKSWKNYEEILDRYRVIVARRPVFEDLVFDRLFIDYKRAYPDSVFLLDSPIIDISSTYIREKKRKDQSIRYMVPERVNEYVLDRNLYVDR